MGRPSAMGVLDAAVHGLDRAYGRRVGAPSREALEARVRTTTGLTDLGPLDYREPLDLLCAHLREGKPMHAMSRLMMAHELTVRLRAWAQVHDYVRAHPAVRSVPVAKPWVILGLPRTGSTFLHRLLAEDPRHRAPRLWEMTYPVPPPDPPGNPRDKRARSSRAFARLANHAAPRLASVHEVGADLPEECIALFANAFRSQWFTATLDSPYRAWLADQDLGPAYAFHQLQLQLLGSVAPERRWVLKAPWHLHGLRWLVETYPDACVIHTHRDPFIALGSSASLLTVLRKAIYLEVDPAGVAAEVVHDLHRWLEEGQRARESEETRPGSRVRFVDVHYEALRSRPLETVRAVYAHFDVPLPRDIEARMRAHLRDAPQHRHGVHRYSLSDRGFTPDDLRPRFSEYCSRYGVSFAGDAF